MSTTSQNIPSKFRSAFGHNPLDNRTLYWTLVACTILGVAIILVLYIFVFGKNPAYRWEYALLVSVPPAFGALLVVKLTTVFDSWRGPVIIYFALYSLAFVIQAVGRNIIV